MTPRRRAKADSRDRQSLSGPVPGLESRKAAARLLAAVVDARTPLDGLTDAEHGHPQFRALETRDRAMVRAMLVTALRFRATIAALVADRLERPLPSKARTLEHILHVAAAQILFLDTPDSAAVDIAVTQARTDPRTARFAGLVNAVLRRLSREKAAALPDALEATRDAPEWFVTRLEAAYGARHAADILAAHRVEPPTDFSVKADPHVWAGTLGGVVLPSGSVRVAGLPGPVPALSGYAEGAWWVQDAAASLPARLLGNVAGLRVADLCAAPGGKTAQLAHAGARVTAVDASPGRVKRLAANLARLRLPAEIVEADVLSFHPDTPFDAVLLDAPCSSTGTVRRHPDIVWTKRPEDIDKLAELQGRLLEKAVEMVKPGGTLVFSNCSLDPKEGEELVDAFLCGNHRVALAPIGLAELPGIADFLTPRGTLRTTPAGLAAEDPRAAGLDGFFAARLRRTA